LDTVPLDLLDIPFIGRCKSS